MHKLEIGLTSFFDFQSGCHGLLASAEFVTDHRWVLRAKCPHDSLRYQPLRR